MIRAFTNADEFMMWMAQNCEQCSKNYTCDPDGNNGVTLCDIEEAVSLSAASAGEIQDDIAKRAGLPSYERSCSEFCEVTI